MVDDDYDPGRAMYRHRTDSLVTDRGSGPALVCSHGTLMDRTMFAPQLAALSDEFRVVAYDSRARTDRWRGPYDLDDLADDCRAVVDAVGVDSAVLLGMSMGGYMALRFALRHPEKLDGLVLVDSQAQTDSDEERAEYAGMVGEIEGADHLPDPLVEMVADQLFGESTHEERPDLVERWTDRWLTYPGDAVAAEVGSWLDRPGLLDRLDEIDVPALVFHGEEDFSIPIERAERTVEGLPDARLVTVPEAGHSSNTERPEPVNDELRAFLHEVY